MSDEPQSPSQPDVGQSAAAPWAQGTTEAAPAPPEGQAQAPHGQDQGQAIDSTPATDEPSFFDVTQVPPELLPAYKQMQAAFTTKTQNIAREKQKIEAYNAFMADPVGQMQQLALRYGMRLTRAEAQEQINQAQQGQPDYQNWQPDSWGEVRDRLRQDLRQELRNEILQEMSPYLGQVQKMQASNIESQLNSIDQNWRDYEGQMRDLLNAHPSLVNDVGMLYRLAVPQEVLEAKAIQQALKRYEDKAKHTGVTSGGSAPRSKPAPTKISSFDEAYQEAKRKILSGEA